MHPFHHARMTEAKLMIFVPILSVLTRLLLSVLIGQGLELLFQFLPHLVDLTTIVIGDSLL